MQNSTPPENTADSIRISGNIENWKRKLLDLTKRNKALNFKATKTATVVVADEQPAEVFRHLVVQELPFRFKAKPETNEERAKEKAKQTSSETVTESVVPDIRIELISASGIDVEEEESELDNKDFAPYDSSAVEDRHRDDFLQTALTPESLDKSLRRLDEQSRLSIEEQGVNTMFLAVGMLQYAESRDSEQVFRAPLVLVPVELSRKSARTGYQLQQTADDAIVNPALAEYLRSGFGIALPELPDSSALTEAYDLQEFFLSVSKATSLQKSWAVKTDIVLALFSFQKFVMYKDIATNAPTIGEHRLIKQLVTRRSDDARQTFGLPNDIRQMDLDAEYPSESTYQVVDADSSQLRAIAAVARQNDLVVEGPPGTGKSQTITNLIAQSLAVGKSVLFVAEKMAALSVVQNRLFAAGLGEFCLELHSNKANKRSVTQSLGAALNASLQPIAGKQNATSRLPHVRKGLTEYVRALHEPYGKIGISPYIAFGEYHAVKDAQRISLSANVAEISRNALDDANRELGVLQAAAAAVGDVKSHPWRDSTRTFYQRDDLDDIRNLAQRLIIDASALMSLVAEATNGLGLPPVVTLGDVDTVAALGELLAQSPGASKDVLQSDAWNAPPESAQMLIKQGEEIRDAHRKLSSLLSLESLERSHAEDVAYIKKKSEGFLSFLAALDGRYRSIKKKWMGWRTPQLTGSLLDQADTMEAVDSFRSQRDRLEAQRGTATALFGPLWKGLDSDWQALRNYVQWVVRFRNACVQHGLSERAVDTATSTKPDISAVHRLKTKAAEFASALEKLQAEVGWPAAYLASDAISAIATRLQELGDTIESAPAWARFELARTAVSQTVARELLPAILAGELPAGEARSALTRAFWAKWLTQCISSRQILERFSSTAHEERVAEFRALDSEVLKENRAALVGKLREETQHRLGSLEAKSGLAIIRKEIARQRGHAPLRRTLTQAEAAVRAIKPCWLMSPLTVAQYVRGDGPSFDVVIFDEASQLPVEDAVGAVMRGKQLVVVGDPKQLPPTNFFAASVGQADVPRDEFGMPIYEDSESILEEFMASGTPMSRLRWHYRSAHESLINFSNVSFYDSDLFTFPSVDSGEARQGLKFTYVEGGVYEGKGLNSEESRKVVDEVVRFAKEQLEKKRHGEPTDSLGVGTFNMRQQLAIQDELELRRREDPSIEPFFDRSVGEPFFVKNLENIQGDERDCIILSVTYAKGLDGKMRYNFGPLNGENGWRRLNVLVTRARKSMLVFSSIRGEDINTAATSARGADLLRQFLTYAEKGRIDSATISASAETESPFEREVLQELTTRGFDIVPQIGVAGYRIDLGVRDKEVPGRFICGIECDGVAYHNSETARDRDRLRQQVLEARGWTIVRVWSTDWFKDRSGQITRLVQLIHAASQEARDSKQSDDAARERLKQQAVEEQRQAEALGLALPDDVVVAYVRPIATEYKLAPVDGRFAGTDLVTAPSSQLSTAINSVVHHEGPIHEADLATRVASAWGVRTGSRILARIQAVQSAMESSGTIVRRGEFLWRAETVCKPRSRATVKTVADRIAPEEYQETIRLVLGTEHCFSRPQLTTEVRTVLGFARTGAALDEAIGAAIDALLESKEIGEGATGLRMRGS